MSKWYEYQNPFESHNGGTPAAALARRIGDWEKRLVALEKRVDLLEGNYTDQTRTAYSWGNGGGDAYYHRQDLAGTMERFAPWVSTTSRIAADLTSSQTVRRTLGEASLAGIFFTAAGGFLAGLGQIPWYGAPIVGFTGASLTLAVLVVHNRTLLHRLVTSQVERSNKRRQELHIQVDKIDEHGHKSVEFLLVSGITREQLVEFAPQALHQENLSVNLIGGGGKIFTQGQAQALGAELELLGYASEARGPVGRKLTAKGRAFFRGLAEKGK